MNSDDFLQLMAKYKFTIAFENAIGDDYITEKLWRPLMLGSVPIYLGSPSIHVIRELLMRIDRAKLQFVEHLGLVTT